MIALQNYLHLRRLGIRGAWGMASMGSVVARAFWFILWLCAMVICLVSVQLQIESARLDGGKTAEAALAERAAEIGALTKIVTACLGDKDGAIYIGNELYLCGISPTGIKRN